MQSVTSEIKKGKGIDDVVRGITPGRVENERLIEQVGPCFGDIMERMRMFLDDSSDMYQQRKGGNIVECGGYADGLVLTPSQIEAFLKSTVVYETHNNYRYGSFFINRLIQNSYGAGNNGFVLVDCEPGFGLYGLPQNLKGEKGRLMKIDHNGRLAEKLTGTLCEHVELVIHGRATKYIAQAGRNSTFVFMKGYESACGDNSEDCRFMTPHEPTLRKLIEDIPKTRNLRGGPSGNSIVFMKSDGTNVVKVQYVKQKMKW